MTVIKVNVILDERVIFPIIDNIFVFYFLDSNNFLTDS